MLIKQNIKVHGGGDNDINEFGQVMLKQYDR